MIGDVTFTNLNAVIITFNDDGGAYPITSFDDPIEQEFERNSKMQQDGLWPAFGYDRGMEITLEGQILADDSDDYTTKRNALTSCLRYKPIVRQYRSGVIEVDFDGASELVKADVNISSMDIPRAGVSPNFSEYRIVLFSFLPYWVGSISGNSYYDS